MQKLNKFYDSRGLLVPINFSELPFEPKRIFYVTDVPTETWRGNHAHYKNRQLLICIKGRITVKLETKEETREFTLNENDFCFVDKMVWDSQKFLDENSTLLVICSEEYDSSDYILNKSIILD